MTDNQIKFCNMVQDIYSLKLTIDNMQSDLDYQREVTGDYAADKLSANEYKQAIDWCIKQGWIKQPYLQRRQLEYVYVAAGW